MAETRREASQIAKEAEKPGSQAGQHSVERLAGLGQEGIRRVADAPIAAAGGALRSGSAIAESTKDIAEAWARYAEAVVRHTSEASRALLRARTFGEMLEVQAKLMRDNMQAFLDQSARVAETAGSLATRPFEALTEAGPDQTRR